MTVAVAAEKSVKNSSHFLLHLHYIVEVRERKGQIIVHLVKNLINQKFKNRSCIQ